LGRVRKGVLAPVLERIEETQAELEHKADQRDAPPEQAEEASQQQESHTQPQEGTFPMDTQEEAQDTHMGM